MNYFIGRQNEIRFLDQFWASAKAEFVVIYGRRRVGKTTLLFEWMKREYRGFYWVATTDNSNNLLRSFSQTIYEFGYPDMPIPPQFSYQSWDEAFRELANFTKEERLLVILDEFTYLSAADASIASVLQHAWDQDLKNCNLMLVITGSHLGMMRRDVISARASLYGRMTGEMFLQPLSFGMTREYFPNYGPEERVQVYSMLGGVPGYWELIDTDKAPLESAVQLFTGKSQFGSEVSTLIHDYLSDPHNYIAILRAISFGYRDRKGIHSYSGIPMTSLAQYLQNLQAGGYIDTQTPITQKGKVQNKRYFIIDPPLRFYFRFSRPSGVRVGMAIGDRTKREIERKWDEFIGTHTFEELCREWLWLAGSETQELPVMIDDIGSTWNQAYQIDVVGINRHEKILVLGEAKWTKDIKSSKIIERLVKIAFEVLPQSEIDKWQVFLLGFSKNGWTTEAKELANQWNQAGLNTGSWQFAGVKLLDLEMLDDDFSRWANATI